MQTRDMDFEWLSEFDEVCFSHPGSFDPQSLVECLAAMAALPHISYSFPQSVYLRVMANPGRFGSYSQLAALLHCLGPDNVPSTLWDEERFLDCVGGRMGDVLISMGDEEGRHAVSVSLCKSRVLSEVIRVADLA